MLADRCDRRPTDIGRARSLPYARGVPDFADDPTTELERKARALSATALTETVTYLVLFYFWIIQPNVAGKAITGRSTGWCGSRSARWSS